MELLKIIAVPFQKIFSFFTEEIPHEKKAPEGLTTLGYLRLQEKLKEKRRLEEQQNKPS